MIDPFNRLRIGERIGISFGIVGLLFLAVIWQYHSSLERALGDYQMLQDVYEAEETHALAIENSMLEARQSEKDFLLTRDMQLMALQREGFRPVSTEITNQEMNQVFGEFVAQNELVPDLVKASQILIPAQKGSVIEALAQTYQELQDPEGGNL